MSERTWLIQCFNLIDIMFLSTDSNFFRYIRSLAVQHVFLNS